MSDIQTFTDFVDACPSPFHTIDTMRHELVQNGFCELFEHERWSLETNHSYFVVRNDSSLMAFRTGTPEIDARFLIVAAHADSPALYIKPHPTLQGPGPYTRLNVEAYGSPIDHTWLDRPLSIAGRLTLREENHISSRLVALNPNTVVIPSVAIHLNRSVNESLSLNRQIDLCPLFCTDNSSESTFGERLARELDVAPERILAYDLIVCNRQPTITWGASDEFVSGPRLDDLQCAYAGLQALLSATSTKSIAVFGCFNHEEVGSTSMQGAQSSFAADILERIASALGMDAEDYRCARARSIVVSCDNAQAVHPNHPELLDERNRVWLNQGVVIKHSAQQRYTTDAWSRALFEEVCREADVPTQQFANRSDIPYGTTIGSLLASKIGCHTVDVGLAQLAMHSVYETAGALDTMFLAKALGQFYATNLC